MGYRAKMGLSLENIGSTTATKRKLAHNARNEADYHVPERDTTFQEMS